MGWGLLYQECYSYILNLELELMMVLMLFYDKALNSLIQLIMRTQTSHLLQNVRRAHINMCSANLI